MWKNVDRAVFSLVVRCSCIGRVGTAGAWAAPARAQLASLTVLHPSGVAATSQGTHIHALFPSALGLGTLRCCVDGVKSMLLESIDTFLPTRLFVTVLLCRIWRAVVIPFVYVCRELTPVYGIDVEL